MTKTVYVLGAGASNEVGLPVGEELMQAIKPLVDIGFQHAHQTSGDRTIALALQHAIPDQGERGRAVEAGWQIRDCVDLAPSIDNFIDSRRGDPHIELCGKLAIGKAILSAERRSGLFLDERNGQENLNHANLKTTWFNKFGKLLTARCHKDELAERLAQVAMVIFNYDRCFEHYLALHLKDYYAIARQEADALVLSMEIYHPYGTVGALPRPGETGIPFGMEPGPTDLLNIAATLKTFTEADKASDIEAIRKLMAGASRVVSLGFGFLPLNMDLLMPIPKDGAPQHSGRFYGTALGASNPNVEATKFNILSRAGISWDRIQLANLKAGPMMDHFSQSLRFD